MSLLESFSWFLSWAWYTEQKLLDSGFGLVTNIEDCLLNSVDMLIFTFSVPDPALCEQATAGHQRQDQLSIYIQSKLSSCRSCCSRKVLLILLLGAWVNHLLHLAVQGCFPLVCQDPVIMGMNVRFSLIMILGLSSPGLGVWQRGKCV